MKPITPETTLGDIVRANMTRARVLDDLGIDYCCSGNVPLADACRAKGLDPATVIAKLTAMDTAPGAGRVDPDGMTLSELCDHIETVHHRYLDAELPRLDAMTRKVAEVHGDRDPRLREVRRIFETLQASMRSHSKEEEDLVFPMIRRLESAGADRASVAAAFRESFAKLEAEHDRAGSALAKFRQLTDNYTPPGWACDTYRATLEALDRLERDTHLHVHKENNVLFDRARSLCGAR
jgi:regulator of cell morphogenesis and NO signaling